MAPHKLPINLNEGCDGVLYCTVKWAYDVTNGMFWSITLLSFCVIIFIASQQFGTSRAFSFAGLCGLIGSVFLATLQLMPYWIASAFILVGVIGLGMRVLAER